MSIYYSGCKRDRLIMAGWTIDVWLLCRTRARTGRVVTARRVPRQQRMNIMSFGVHARRADDVST